LLFTQETMLPSASAADSTMESQLSAMGHTVKSVSGDEMGGVQIIMRDHGYYRSGSDFRKDGEAVGW
jgi:gamma-glutamyltranspeptidase